AHELAEKRRAHLAHLPLTLTIRAARTAAARRARSLAGLARLRALQSNALGRALGDLLEREGELDLQVLAASRPATRTAPALLEQILEAAEASEVAHEGAQRVRDVEVRVRGATARGFRGVAELVVAAAAVRVAQHLVGFRRFLEARFGRVVAGIAVGMELQRELAIGLLDGLLARGALDTQDFVVVALGGHQRFSAGVLATVTLAGRSRRSPRR